MDKKQPTQKPDIDLALSVLCSTAQYGQTLTLKDIAEVCDCSPMRIQQIQTKAIAKLRHSAKLKTVLEDWSCLH